MAETAELGVSHEYLYWLIVVGAVLVFVALTAETVKRLPLSYAVLYLCIGLFLGPTALDLVSWDPVANTVVMLRLTEIAVLVSLFASGVLIGRPLEWKQWSTPARLLLVAMPLTIGLLALAGWGLLGLPIGAAILLGAILAPTDPVLASDVQVTHAEDPSELRFGLTAEAGLNDGLAFPFVTLGLWLLIRTEPFAAWGWQWFLSDVVWAIPVGLGIGYGVAYVVGRALVYVRRTTDVNTSLEAFAGLGLTVGTYALADLAGAWGFLAAFAAGLAIGRVERDAAKTATTTRERKAPLGALHNFYTQLERLGEIAVMLLLGSQLRWDAIAAYAPVGLLVAALLLVVIRPATVALALVGSALGREARVLTAWFGIRGIGSLYYLSYSVANGLDGALAASMTWVLFTVVTASVVAHGTTATPFMEIYRRRAGARLS
jgi:NhaP-type Na+/H+ or K+/H+ antiporter